MHFFIIVTSLIGTVIAGLISGHRQSPEYKLRSRLNHAQILGQHWSNTSTILQHGLKVYTYHNYTLTDPNNGIKQQPRWTTRDTSAAAIKTKRGLIVGADELKWTAQNAHFDQNTGAIQIVLCYFDAPTRTRVRDYLVPAIKRWHDALGCNKGIMFVIQGPLCNNPARSVFVVMNPDATSMRGEASIGAAMGANNPHLPGVPYWIMLPTPNAGNNPASNGYTYIDMVTHELGHTLGLYHEHTRPDFQNWGLAIDCSQIRGYQAAVALTNTGAHRWPATALVKPNQPISMQDLCTYGELSGTSLAGAPFLNVWEGRHHVPQTLHPGPGTYQVNVLGQQGIPRPHGSFDWDSIMLYPTREDMVHWRVFNGQRQEVFPSTRAPGRPSQGDIDAVKSMYPDINPLIG